MNDKKKEEKKPFKPTKRFVRMEGAPNVWIKKTSEISVAETLRRMEIGKPVEFKNTDISVSSIRASAWRMTTDEDCEYEFDVTNPKEDNWSTAWVVRRK